MTQVNKNSQQTLPITDCWLISVVPIELLSGMVTVYASYLNGWISQTLFIKFYLQVAYGLIPQEYYNYPFYVIL